MKLYSVTFTETRNPRCGLCKKRHHIGRWEQGILLDEITIRPVEKRLRNIAYTVCDFATHDRTNVLKIVVSFNEKGVATNVIIPSSDKKDFFSLRTSRNEVIDAIIFADKEFSMHGDYIPYSGGIYQNEDLVKKLSQLITNL